MKHQRPDMNVGQGEESNNPAVEHAGQADQEPPSLADHMQAIGRARRLRWLRFVARLIALDLFNDTQTEKGGNHAPSQF